MSIIVWIPILFVALIAVPAAIGAASLPHDRFRSFRERMRERGEGP
jgi:hypothetical protein